MVEQLTLNQLVPGSSPGGGTTSQSETYKPPEAEVFLEGVPEVSLFSLPPFQRIIPSRHRILRQYVEFVGTPVVRRAVFRASNLRNLRTIYRLKVFFKPLCALREVTSKTKSASFSCQIGAFS
jgi:hypothetical protein